MFILLEIMQISAEKINYFVSFYNLNDVLSFVCFIIYYRLRMEDSASCIPAIDQKRPLDTQMKMTILNLVLLVQSIIKIFFLTRVFEKIGQLVQLVIQCIHDVFLFLFFYLVFLFYFFLMFLVSGANVSPDDYSSL